MTVEPRLVPEQVKLITCILVVVFTGLAEGLDRSSYSIRWSEAGLDSQIHLGAPINGSELVVGQQLLMAFSTVAKPSDWTLGNPLLRWSGISLAPNQNCTTVSLQCMLSIHVTPTLIAMGYFGNGTIALDLLPTTFPVSVLVINGANQISVDFTRLPSSLQYLDLSGTPIVSLRPSTTTVSNYSLNFSNPHPNAPTRNLFDFRLLPVGLWYLDLSQTQLNGVVDFSLLQLSTRGRRIVNVSMNDIVGVVELLTLEQSWLTVSPGQTAPAMMMDFTGNPNIEQILAPLSRQNCSASIFVSSSIPWVDSPYDPQAPPFPFRFQDGLYCWTPPGGESLMSILRIEKDLLSTFDPFTGLTCTMTLLRPMTVFPATGFILESSAWVGGLSPCLPTAVLHGWKIPAIAPSIVLQLKNFTFLAYSMCPKSLSTLVADLEPTPSITGVAASVTFSFAPVADPSVFVGLVLTDQVSSLMSLSSTWEERCFLPWPVYVNSSDPVGFQSVINSAAVLLNVWRCLPRIDNNGNILKYNLTGSDLYLRYKPGGPNQFANAYLVDRDGISRVTFQNNGVLPVVPGQYTFVAPVAAFTLTLTAMEGVTLVVKPHIRAGAPTVTCSYRGLMEYLQPERSNWASPTPASGEIHRIPQVLTALSKCLPWGNITQDTESLIHSGFVLWIVSHLTYNWTQYDASQWYTNGTAFVEGALPPSGGDTSTTALLGSEGDIVFSTSNNQTQFRFEFNESAGLITSQVYCRRANLYSAILILTVDEHGLPSLSILQDPTTAEEAFILRHNYYYSTGVKCTGKFPFWYRSTNGSFYYSQQLVADWADCLPWATDTLSLTLPIQDMFLSRREIVFLDSGTPALEVRLVQECPFIVLQPFCNFNGSGFNSQLSETYGLGSLEVLASYETSYWGPSTTGLTWKYTTGPVFTAFPVTVPFGSSLKTPAEDLQAFYGATQCFGKCRIDYSFATTCGFIAAEIARVAVCYMSRGLITSDPEVMERVLSLRNITQGGCTDGPDGYELVLSAMAFVSAPENQKRFIVDCVSEQGVALLRLAVVDPTSSMDDEGIPISELNKYPAVVPGDVGLNLTCSMCVPFARRRTPPPPWVLILVSAGLNVLVVLSTSVLSHYVQGKKVSTAFRLWIARSTLLVTAGDEEKYRDRLESMVDPEVLTCEERDQNIEMVKLHVFKVLYAEYEAELHNDADSTLPSSGFAEDVPRSDELREIREVEFEALYHEAMVSSWPYRRIQKPAFRKYQQTIPFENAIIQLWKSQDALAMHHRTKRRGRSHSDASRGPPPEPMDVSEDDRRRRSMEGELNDGLLVNDSEADRRRDEESDVRFSVDFGSNENEQMFKDRVAEAKNAVIRAVDDAPKGMVRAWIGAEDWLHFRFLTPSEVYFKFQLIVILVAMVIFLGSDTDVENNTGGSALDRLQNFYFPVVNSTLLGSCILNFFFLALLHRSRFLERQLARHRYQQRLQERCQVPKKGENSATYSLYSLQSDKPSAGHVLTDVHVGGRKELFLHILKTGDPLFYIVILVVAPAFGLNIVPGFFVFFPYLCVPTVLLLTSRLIARCSLLSAPRCKGGVVDRSVGTVTLVLLHLFLRMVSFMCVVLIIQSSHNYWWLAYYKHIPYWDVFPYAWKAQSMGCTWKAMQHPTLHQGLQIYVMTLIVG